ncbi:MAG: peroxiredoxin [Gammaproteobacteria bacterium]|nr:peroxiredoxin [Gammaproteobacteria bacterium]
MKGILKKTALLLFNSLFLMGQATADTELVAGSAAPELNLKDQNFKTHKLADYKGQWLVIYFYPKDDTPGCTTEACQFRDDILQIRALNASILGISLDDVKSHEEFANKYSLPFPLLADTRGDVAQAYGALFKLGPIKFSRRHSFIIGPDGLIKKIYRDVDPEKHSQQIINDLKLLAQ